MNTRILLTLAVGLLAARAFAVLPAFDFTTPDGTHDWHADHDISLFQNAPDGLAVQISGDDPYFSGPSRDYPPGTNLWLHLRLKSEQGGTCQVFYFRDQATEANSVRFNVPAGQWQEAQVPMPALGPGYHLRIDPPGNGGSCILQRLWTTERISFKPPVWPKPQVITAASDALTLGCGSLNLIHNRNGFGSFILEVSGHRMAQGNPQSLIGYVENGQIRWFPVNGSNVASVRFEEKTITAVVQTIDPDGARWNIEQRFSPGLDNTIGVETRVTVDRDRSAFYLPMLTVLPGVGAFGTNKTQGLFAGLEYLENEPSSSKADLIGPESQRQVPDRLKITFPLMAIQADGRYLGLVWEPSPKCCALFDSPDRVFETSGHLMGILFPGSDGMNRPDGNVMPYRPEVLHANQPLTLRATLIGGPATSVVPAVQDYVKLRGLPPLPDPGLTAHQYFDLAAHGWLDSTLGQSNLYRHAVWPGGFRPQPSSDAALWMEWLADKVDDAPLANRLTNASVAALQQVAPPHYNGTQIGHVRYPLPALVFGAVNENAEQSQAHGCALLGRFQTDGSVIYTRTAGETDYAKTHWSREANGLTAEAVAELLEAAVFSGDPELIRQGLDRLRAMEKFNNTVPRGAQTWEVPLHTPDILASANLLRAYTLGYELTGDTNFLAQARYWAWTGIPFIYLTQPTAQPVGLYSTIPVLGATGWTAPVWIGLPVQWCGLVYAEALYRFAKYDPSGPWKQLADGIVVAGIQHSWPLSDPERKGLLPDSFALHSQTRNGPAINPATLLGPAVKYYQQPLPYSFSVCHGLLIHAPGEIKNLTEIPGGVRFSFTGWSKAPAWLLINGFSQKPRVQINGKEVALTAPHVYQAEQGRLILQVSDSVNVGISF